MLEDCQGHIAGPGSRLAQDHRLLGYASQRNVLFSDQRMVARREHYERIRRKCTGFDIKLVAGRLTHDIEVILVGADTLDDAIPVRNLQRHLDPGVQLAELAKHFRCEILCRRDDTQA